jgi:putative phosphoesterase
MRVVALSDTHAPRFWKACPPAVARQLELADLILHAGDVCVPSVLEELAAFAPVRAVLGNNDGPEVAAWGAPGTAEFEIDGLAVAMIHDSGPRTGRLPRLRKRFPDAALVVFGHSHIPLDESADGFRILNPGSPTDRRRQPHGTVAVLDVTAARIERLRLVDVS